MTPVTPSSWGELARVAIIATPRSGNSWLRTLLRVRFGLTEIAVHAPEDLPGAPPERAVIQLHWVRDPHLEGWLDEHQVRVVTISRHPFDVLLSMLHFASHEPETSEWLRAGLTAGLAGASPTSEAFRSFATGPAAQLLGVTPAWLAREGTLRVRYEDLCADTAAVLGALCDQLGFDARTSVEEALAAGSFGVFQALPNRHGWQGRPGLWRSLLLPELARAIHAANRSVFDALGYGCDPDPTLVAAVAEQRWDELRIPA